MSPPPTALSSDMLTAGLCRSRPTFAVSGRLNTTRCGSDQRNQTGTECGRASADTVVSHRMGAADSRHAACACPVTEGSSNGRVMTVDPTSL